MQRRNPHLSFQMALMACVILLTFYNRPVDAQKVRERDIFDLFSDKDTAAVSVPQIGKLYMPLLPIIGYTPSTGFMLGAGIAGSILLDSAQNTHISSGLANVLFTTEHQTNLIFRHNIYLSNDTWIFQGDWRLMFFKQPTYGLGIQDIPAVFSLNGIGLDDETGAQPMGFDYVRIYETVFRRINNRLYAGGGLAVDYHFKVVDERLDLNGSPPFYTSHYYYSTLKEFPLEKYAAIGLTGKLLYDSRDNAINAYSGTYLDFGFRVNGTFLGSNKNSSLLLLEARKYQKLGSANNLLAFWLIGNFRLTGSIPYLALPAIGWDTYNRSGRGYLQGRFRGENMVYAESEFRYKISPSGMLGGVLFVNAVSADNEAIDQKLFDAFAYGYGAGLRIKMSKETRTNICVDLGLGQNNSGGIYFGIQEAF
jgi:hypothetical protein